MIAAFDRVFGQGSGRYSVLNPRLSPGVHDPVPKGDAIPWVWEIANVAAEEHLIRESHGSGAIQIFQALRRAVDHLAGIRGTDLPALSGWFQPGVDFSCGACFTPSQTAGEIFVSAGSFRAYRSDSTLFHEAGHFAFPVLGGMYWEVGQHCFGVPAPPGQAFAEGHAHWYASDLRREGSLFQERSGTFYYWDLDAMEPAELFLPPGPQASPADEVNESWLAAALWHLAKEHGSGHPLHLATAALEMQPPLASGYTAKRWEEIDAACKPIDPQDTGYPTPVLADFLNALVCRGFPATLVEEIVSPHYPYDPHRPSCK